MSFAKEFGVGQPVRVNVLIPSQTGFRTKKVEGIIQDVDSFEGEGIFEVWIPRLEESGWYRESQMELIEE